MVASVKVFQLCFQMINKHLIPEGAPIATASREMILPPSRISVDFKKVESVDEDKQTTILTLFVEPINIDVGFREVVFFKGLAEYYQTKLVSQMPKIEQTVQPKQETKVEEKKLPYEVNILQVDAKIDIIQITITDDTGAITQQLFKVLLTNLGMKMSSTTLIDERRRQSLKGNKEYMSANARFSMEALFYNNLVSDYEPVIEGWGVECDFAQAGAQYGKEISIRAEKMLNVNLSYAGIFKRLKASCTCHWSDAEKTE